MRIILFNLVFIFCLTTGVICQNFTEFDNRNISGLQIIDASSADLNNDGRFEFLVAGLRSGQIVHYLIHNSEGVSTLLENPFPNAPYGNYLLEDFNKDGFIDVLITQETGLGGHSKVYLNQGDFSFELSQEFKDEDNLIRFAQLVDFDNDGQKEILSWGGVIFKNNSLSGTSFYIDQKIDTEINKFSFSKFTHFDANNDGYQDIVYFQARTNGDHELFLNNKNGSFDRQSFTQIDTNISEAIPVDINSDGVEELAILEEQNDEFKIRFYSYSDGVLSIDVSKDISVDNISQNLIFLDIDQDGDVDILQAGLFNGDKLIHRLYTNDSNSGFSDGEDFEFDAWVGRSVFGDFDNDGDLDLFSNEPEPSTGLILFKNDFSSSNDLNDSPQVPSGLTSSSEGSGIRLSWNVASDSESTMESLTYNVFIRNTESGDYFLRPLANSSELTLLGAGNVGTRVDNHFSCLPNGTYTWGVQTVDLTFMVSDFVEGQSFQINREFPIAPGGLSVARATEGIVELNWSDESGNESDYFVFRRNKSTPDFPNAPIAILPENSMSFLDDTVMPETSYEYKVVAFSCGLNSPFSIVSAITRITPFTLARALQIDDFGGIRDFKGSDIDNDGLMDMFVLGNKRSGASLQLILRNKGELEFEQTSNFLEQPITGRFQVEDLDQDNQMDMFVFETTGNPKGDFPELIRNNGGGVFSNFFEAESSELNNRNLVLANFYNDKNFEVVEVSQKIKIFQKLSLDEVAYWPRKTLDLSLGHGEITGHTVIDFDRDGQKDILIFRLDGLEVFTNQGDYDFRADFYPTPDNFLSQLVADIDGNGSIDILAARVDSQLGDHFAIYSLVNNAIVVKETTIPVGLVTIKQIDIDNDGLLDIVHGSERDIDSQKNFLVVYRNKGNGDFEQYSKVQLPELSGHRIEAWDFDNDGDVDIVVLGEHLRSGEELYVYRNNLVDNDESRLNQKPVSPSSITIEVDNENNSVEVSWQVGTDNETQSEALKYAISIEDADGGLLYSSGITHAGQQLAVNLDLVERLETIIRCIPDGDFRLFVQSIDGGGSASNRGEGQSFTVTGTQPLPVTGLETRTLSHRTIELKWTDMSDREKEYRIYRKQFSADNYDPLPFAIIDENSEHFFDSLTAPDVEYEYRVVAFNCAFPEESVTVTGKTFPRLFSEIQTIDLSDIGDLDFLGKGDIDADGDEDFLVRAVANNNNSYALLINNSSVFELRTLEFPQGSRRAGAAVLVDYDLDNDLDIYLLSNDESGFTPISNMYINDGNGSFSETSVNFNFPINLSITNTPPIWMDFDRDGDLDLFFTVDVVDNVGSFVIYEQRDGIFIQKDHEIEGIIKSKNPFADYDNDGEPDLLILGNDNSLSLFSITVNNVFTEEEISGFGIYGAFDPDSDGTLEWFDYNGDGFLDILMSGAGLGMSDLDAKLSILINTGGNGFTRLSDPIKNSTPLTYGDFDNDGDVDIITATSVVLVLENLDGEGIKDYISKVDFAGVNQYSDLALSDIDNDGDLDLLIAHSGLNNDLLKVYENVAVLDWGRSNMAPSVPQNLQIDDLNAAIRFSWDSSNDDLTNRPALTYEVSMKDQLTGEFIYPSLIDSEGMSLGTNLSSITSSNDFLFRTGRIDEMIVAFSVRSVDQNGLKSVYSEQFLFNTITSASEELIESSFKLFPNPVEEILQLSFDNVGLHAQRFEVVDLKGETMLVKRITTTESMEMDLSSLSSGVYLVKLYFEESIEVKRIIKK